MATNKKPSYLMAHLVLPTTQESNDHVYEFEESDVWNSSSYETQKKNAPSNSRKNYYTKKITNSSNVGSSSGKTSSSLPVNVPDWSKIYKKEKEELSGEEDSEFCENDEEEYYSGEGGALRVPPHEYLARQRGASFSVEEGIGRTLKGRDLFRVRNAILKKMGFED